MSEEELESRRTLTKEVKKLQKQFKNLAKSEEMYRKRFEKSYIFETEFRKVATRFENRKYDSEWPIQRFIEAFLYLRSRLP